MISVSQSSYYANLFDAIWQPIEVPEAKSHGKSLADTLIIPFEEKAVRHLSDDQPEADKVLLYMLTNDIPQTIVHSIVRSDSYDIIVPSNTSTAPYIAISYADDTEDEKSAFINDTCPIQDPEFLRIPSPDVISADEEEISDEACSDTFAEGLDASSCAVVDFDELGDWESTTDLERYFSGCDHRFEAIAPPETSLVSLTSVGSSPNIVFKNSRDLLKLKNEDPEISEEVDISWNSYESDAESELTRSSDSE